MGKNERWYKFQKGLEKVKNWFRKIRTENVEPNKGVEDLAGIAKRR